jgi:hypothetical protein
MGDPKCNRLPHLCGVSRIWICAEEQIRDFLLAGQILGFCQAYTVGF